ncbi:hypothetical protein [Streptosporangium lutulentum]|uniref:Abortive infection protein n=1 Tax=Streptosporangium lutulentum TaxID=1461250 RepID=A0ABT9Q6L1_9ACTN|nr:hypothetical protein [Streptosporangium lutulentum]MDP9841759.1 hypothetical protein [Streptosporangium lutulentum]
MRARGINYDTAFHPGGNSSREAFDPEVVRREMRVIADELHCTAVRVSGGDPARLGVAAEHAAAAGLEVWFAPFPCELTTEEMLPYFAECAERAEALRRAGAEVVYVMGCEISGFAKGFLPGDTVMDRLNALMSYSTPEDWAALGPLLERLNAFLAESAAGARKRFEGRITYASAPWEFVDWSPFDLVGVDAYRAEYNAAVFREEVRAHAGHGKPVAVTEFGTCAYRGAGLRGGMAWTVPEGAVRDEGEQVRYFDELLDVFEEEGVDSAFWFTFAGYTRPGDLDLGSYGVVKMIDDTRWEPKEVFHAMAARYARG